ncbi:MAG: helix-turn-helix domain-containing protein [Lachnospirales bacterium]
MGFDLKIREIRIKCLLSQADFAKKIGVSFSTVNRWENNKAVPNYQTLTKIKNFCISEGLTFEYEHVEDNNENN